MVLIFIHWTDHVNVKNQTYTVSLLILHILKKPTNTTTCSLVEGNARRRRPTHTIALTHTHVMFLLSSCCVMSKTSMFATRIGCEHQTIAQSLFICDTERFVRRLSVEFKVSQAVRIVPICTSAQSVQLKRSVRVCLSVRLLRVCAVRGVFTASLECRFNCV